MAKKSATYKNFKRKLKAARAWVKRTTLRKLSKVDSKEGDIARLKLQKAPRDESICRYRERCRVCGRPNGTYRKFGLCRIHLREAAMRGDIPGLRKASW